MFPGKVTCMPFIPIYFCFFSFHTKGGVALLRSACVRVHSVRAPVSPSSPLSHAAPPALLPALCIERTEEYDSVFSTCSYGTLAFNPNRQCMNATSNCSARGVCAFSASAFASRDHEATFVSSQRRHPYHVANQLEPQVTGDGLTAAFVTLTTALQ